MPSPDDRSVCFARAKPSTTGSTASRWLGLDASVTAISPVGRRVHALGAEVVLHVARAALGVADDGGDRPLALELAQDLLVGLADRVREHVQPPAVRHTDHDLVRTARRGQLDRSRPASARARRALRPRTASARGRRDGGTARTPRRATAARAARASRRRGAAAGSDPTRSPAAATCAPRGRRCARPRTRSCRSRSRRGAAAPRRASRRGR